MYKFKQYNTGDIAKKQLRGQLTMQIKVENYVGSVLTFCAAVRLTFDLLSLKLSPQLLLPWRRPHSASTSIFFRAF